VADKPLRSWLLDAVQAKERRYDAGDDGMVNA
jgi:hypothetical protein